MKKNLFKEFEFYYSLIFLVPLIFNPFGYTPFEIPKTAFLVVLISCGTVGVYLYSVFFKKKFFFNRYIFLAVLLWLASSAISAILSSAPLESFWGTYERMQGLLTTIYYLLHFLICFQLIQYKNFREYFFNITLVVGFIISLYAIAQFLLSSSLGIGNIDIFSGRSFSTIGQPNMLAQWLIFPFFVSLFLLLNKKKKLIYFISTVVVFIALMTTFSKATFVGIFVALCFFVAKSLISKSKNKKKVLVIIVILILLGGSLAGILAKNSTRSIFSRITLWQESVPLINQNILFGDGQETYYKNVQKVLSANIYETEGLYSFPTNVHFEAYQILINQGRIGLLLYLLLFGYLAYIYFKKDFRNIYVQFAFYSLVASYVALQFSYSFSAQVIFMGFCLALIVGEYSKMKTIKIKKNLLVAKVTFLLILVIMLGWSIKYAFNIVAADYYFKKSSDNYFEKTDTALQYSGKALESNPNSTYYYSNFIGLFAKYDIEESEIYLEKFKRLSGGSFQYYLAKANLHDLKNEFDQANASYENALAVAPSWALGWQQWGDFLNKNRRIVDAIEKYEKVVELAPLYVWEEGEKTRIFKKSTPLFYFLVPSLQRLYIENGQLDKAEELKVLIK